MKILRTVDFYGRNEDIEKMFNEVSISLPIGWTRDRSEEKESGISARQICFRVEGHPALENASVFIYNITNEIGVYKLRTIRPNSKNQLSEAEWDCIIDEFVDIISRQHAQKYNIEINVSGRELTIDSVFSPNVVENLRAFNSGANKNMLHYYDRRRWYEFIISVHRARDDYAGEILYEYFVVSNWGDESAERLVREYEGMRELLEKYDEMR